MGWFAGNRPSLAYFPSPGKFTTVEYVGQACINGIDRISQLKAFGDPEALIEPMTSSMPWNSSNRKL
jgi:hypothetical protein